MPRLGHALKFCQSIRISPSSFNYFNTTPYTFFLLFLLSICAILDNTEYAHMFIYREEVVSGRE